MIKTRPKQPGTRWRKLIPSWLSVGSRQPAVAGDTADGQLPTVTGAAPPARPRAAGSLTKKASLNAISALLDYGARMAVGFVINPLMVASLGSYLYGVLQILGRLILYMSAASGRPTQALKWTIAHQQASEDYAAKRRNVGGAVVVWLLFLPIMLVLGAGLVLLAPGWLDAPPALAWTVRVAAAIMVVDLVLTTLADIPQSVLQGENLGYKRMGVSTLLVLVGGGGFTALALYLKAGLIGVVLADVGYTLLAGAFFLHVVYRAVPWFGLAWPTRPELRQFFGLSGWFFIWRLVMQLMMSSDVLVLGRLGSVEAVTTYTLTKYVPETLISLVAIMATGITPGLGGVIGAGDLPKAARVRAEMMQITWLVATVLGTAVLLWNRSFVQLWVGHIHYSGDLATLMIMLMVVQFVLIRNDANIIDLSLKLRAKVLVGTASAALSIVLAALCVGVLGWGIAGLCLGFMAGRLILSFGYPWLIGRTLELPLGAQLRGAPRPALVMLALFALAVALADAWQAGSWLGLVAGVALTVVASALLAFYGGLAGSQRGAILRRFGQALRMGSRS